MRKYERKTNRSKRGKHRGSLELRGKVYFARWMVNGQRFSETTGETKRAAAEKWLERKLANVHATDIRAKGKRQIETLLQQKAAQLKGAIVQAEEAHEAALDALPSVALADLEAELTAAVGMNVKPDTLFSYSQDVRTFVKWMAVNHPEAEDANHVSEKIAVQYFDHLAKVKRASTCNCARVNLAHTWNVLNERYRIKGNPWQAVKAMKPEATVRRSLSREELARIAVTLPGEYRLVFFVGCFTGLRLSDAATLTWESIDLNTRTITLRPIKTARTSGRWVHLPIVPEFFAVLSSIPTASRHGYVAPFIADQYQNHRALLSRRFAAYFAKAGIKTQKSDGDGKPARNVCGFHSLRHTFVSIAANAGIPFAIVQSIVGHSAAKMTEHYFHESREATSLAFQKFPELFAAQPVAALPNAAGDVIDIEAVVVEPTADTTASRRAALEAALVAYVRNGSDADLDAAAAFLDERAREQGKA